MFKSKDPMPAGWTKTLDDLLEEVKRGERAAIGGVEYEWAWEYTRHLIPATMRFPKKGDVYEALADMPIRFLTAWRAPYTGSGTAVLKQGERVKVDHDPVDPKPIGTYATAINYAELEARMVPAEERAHPNYSNFYFSFTTVELNTKFRRVEDV